MHLIFVGVGSDLITIIVVHVYVHVVHRPKKKKKRKKRPLSCNAAIAEVGETLGEMTSPRRNTLVLPC